MLDAVRDMVAQDFLLDPAQGGARRRNLRDHVNAITVILDHAGEAANLALVTVLIITCPCALGLATPMSAMVGIGRARMPES